jgi:hypothetical protein
MGRKIDDKNPIPGTRTTDPGSNGRYFPERQCTKKPFPGSSLCAKCAEKEKEFLSSVTGKKVSQYYGRLDQPMYKDAKVVGCANFLLHYKDGIPGVPIVGAAPAAAPVAPAPAAAPVSPAPAAAPVAPVEVAAPAQPKKRGRPSKAVVAPAEAPTQPKKRKDVVASTDVAELPAATGAGDTAAPPPPVEKKGVRKIKKATTTVAADVPPVETEWIAFMFNGLPHARHSSTGNVYPFDSLTNQPERDKYVGKWRNGAVDEYANEDDA